MKSPNFTYLIIGAVIMALLAVRRNAALVAEAAAA
jgi:hypothetical protein